MEFDPAENTWHSDQRVRRQAFVLALKDSRHRDWALAEAISGDDERLVRMALDEVISSGLPEALVPTLINRVLRGDHPPNVRGLAAYALQSSRSLLVRDALIGSAEEKGLFGRVRLGANSPAVVAAISVLARHWRGDADVDRLLERASRAKDQELRAAAEEGASHGD